MRSSLPALIMLPLGALALPGCPSSNSKPGADAPAANPTTLWLSIVGRDEKHVQLVDTEPPPF
jgi:hypothetical protein